MHESTELADKHVCSHDLIEASTYGRRPIFSNFYAGSFEAACTLAGTARPDMPLQVTAGAGFRSAFVHLSASITSTLTDLAILDRLMASSSMLRLDQRQHDTVAAARKDVHHAILSILPWPKLSREEQRSSSFIGYEICRTAAALYSTAVIFPVSPEFPWLNHRLQFLRDLLQSLDVDIWLQQSDKLAVWALFVASIAAYPTEHFAFFRDLLGQQLAVVRLRSFAEVRTAMREFIWSDNACELGASIVWNKLDV